jgi:hypothetical protein
MSAYYSDHDAVYCALPTPGEDRKPDTVWMGRPFDCEQSNSREPKASRKQVPPPRFTRSKAQKEYIYKSKMNMNKRQTSDTATDMNACKKKSHDEIQIVSVDLHAINVNTIDLPQLEDRQAVADYLKVDLKNDAITDPRFRMHPKFIIFQNYMRMTQRLNSHTRACQIDEISADGNCFFRSISKQVLGTQDYHENIRDAICNFMAARPNTFANWIADWSMQNTKKDQHNDDSDTVDTDISDEDCALVSFQEHINKMRNLSTWATTAELTATATFFSCTIKEFTSQFNTRHGWKWIDITPQAISTLTNVAPTLDPDNDGIPLRGNLYLHHSNGNHFDVIAPGTAPQLPFPLLGISSM